MISPKINFTIEEFLYENTTRVVVFIIPAAEGEPTTYQGKPYIRVNSQTTELTPYTDWLRAIYNSQVDWSAQVIEGASLKDLTLQEIVLLDKVQKGEPISAEAVAFLRKNKLVEGRKNSLIVAKEIAQITDQKAQYTRNKGMNDQYYRDFIEKAIDDHKSMSRKDIVELLWNKLPEVLDEKKKNAKIANLLTALRKAGRIKIGKGKTWQKC